MKGASLTTTLAGRSPGSSGKLLRPKRGAAPSAEVMFQTAARCPIPSMAGPMRTWRQRRTAVASEELSPSDSPSRRLSAAYR